MNDILVLLWLADVITKVGFVFFLSGLLIIAVGLTAVIVAKLEKDTWEYKLVPLTGIVLLLIAALIPSKEWLYIAACSYSSVQECEYEIFKKVHNLGGQKLDEVLGDKK